MLYLDFITRNTQLVTPPFNAKTTCKLRSTTIFRYDVAKRLQPLFHSADGEHIKFKALIEFDVPKAKNSFVHRVFTLFFSNMHLSRHPYTVDKVKLFDVHILLVATVSNPVKGPDNKKVVLAHKNK